MWNEVSTIIGNETEIQVIVSNHNTTRFEHDFCLGS